MPTVEITKLATATACNVTHDLCQGCGHLVLNGEAEITALAQKVPRCIKWVW